MNVIPAIDVLGGKVVRLAQGSPDKATAYCDNPAQQAEAFFRQGATLVHAVDLDAALGRGSNFAAMRGIALAALEAKAGFQAGGGVRSVQRARALIDLGVARVFVSTAAFDRAMLAELCCSFGSKVWVACEARQGKAYCQGWTKNSGIGVEELIFAAQDCGAGGLLVTDIVSDGMASGVSLPFFRRMRALTRLPLFAAGGVSSLSDVLALKKLNYDGVIVGRALYEKKFALCEAIGVAENAC